MQTQTQMGHKKEQIPQREVTFGGTVSLEMT